MKNFNPIFPYMCEKSIFPVHERLAEAERNTKEMNFKPSMTIRTSNCEFKNRTKSAAGKLMCVICKGSYNSHESCHDIKEISYMTFMRTFMTVVDVEEIRQRNSMQAFLTIFKSYVKEIHN